MARLPSESVQNSSEIDKNLKLVYSREEIESNHAYAKPHLINGEKLHGGFDESGTYIAPRTLYRRPAVDAWREQLKHRGVDLIDASQELLSKDSFPNYQQQKFLLNHGLGFTFFNALTITGIVEGRGVALVDFVAPDFQDIIVEDVSNTALGHLNKGLLRTHGWDEGGNEQSGEGGHDKIWFAVRDVLFGKGAYSEDIEPENIVRPESESRDMPQVPEFHEAVLSLLMNVLMVEVRAEKFFSYCQAVMTDPELFVDRREHALQSAEMVERIRTDEQIHVDYLQTVLSEFRSLTIKTSKGEHVKGREILDPIWQRMVQWHAHDAQIQARNKSLEKISSALLELDNGEDLLEEFNTMTTVVG